MMQKRGDAPPIPLPLLDQLYHQHFEALVRYASGLIGDQPARAEDIVQEAFARLIKSPPQDMSRAQGWLRTVVQHLCYDQFRQSGHERSVQGTYAQEPQSVPSAEDIVMGKVDHERINRALNRLNPRESRALWLRHTGYSYREIGRELGLDANQVGMMLLRAMKKLKAVYYEEEGTDYAAELPRRGHVAEIPGS